MIDDPEYFQNTVCQTPRARELWALAELDGKTCGRNGGFMEQNPYGLNEPLFDAWHNGWCSGVGTIPIRDLNEMTKKYSSSELRLEEASWTRRVTKSRELSQTKSTGANPC